LNTILSRPESSGEHPQTKAIKQQFQKYALQRQIQAAQTHPTNRG